MASALCTPRPLGLVRHAPTRGMAQGPARPAARLPQVVRASSDRKVAQQQAQQQERERTALAAPSPLRAVAPVAASALLAAAGVLLPLALDAGAAHAVPELLKGRTFSLIHPVSGCVGGVWAGGE